MVSLTSATSQCTPPTKTAKVNMDSSVRSSLSSSVSPQVSHSSSHVDSSLLPATTSSQNMQHSKRISSPTTNISFLQPTSNDKDQS